MMSLSVLLLRQFGSLAPSSVSRKLILALRSRTSMPIVQCKAALEAANGDLDAAIARLEASYASRLEEKKAASESATNMGDSDAGCLALNIAANAKMASLVQTTCQTPYAANSDLFKSCCVSLAERVLAKQRLQAHADSYSLIERPHVDADIQLRTALLEPAAKLKENISIGSIASFRASSASEVLFGYCHPPLAHAHASDSSVKLGRLAALVAIESEAVSVEPAKYQSLMLRAAQQLATTVTFDDAGSLTIDGALERPFIFDAQLSLRQYLARIEPSIRLSRLFIMKLDAPCAPMYLCSF